MQVFGLTGGLGAGKSTVAARLRARGLPVVDADALSRQAVVPGSQALEEIAQSFGAEVVAADGSLDRRRLGDLVFQQDPARSRLEAILHPRIRALAEQRFADLDLRGEPLGCYEVPLLFEVGLDPSLRPVVVVVAPEDVRIQRVALRDNTSREQALACLRAQLPLDDKVARADHVIDNSGPIASTLEQTDRVLADVCRAFGVDPSRYGVGRRSES
jgi:dephospho-CoA kinase